MTISQAKEVQIIDYLEMNGFPPVKINGGKAWYYSLLRPPEKTPSFIINLQQNTWHDFGSGEHGDIISLITKLNQVNISEALELIGSGSGCSYVPFKNNRAESTCDTGKISIEQLLEISHPALIQYLLKRKVSLVFSRMYLKEAHYLLYDRKYFALAFKNDLGGYELRNAHFKSGNTPKYFTTIQGTDHSGINVFEGFMDFLSCCSHYNSIPVFKTVILNSLSFLPRIESMLHDSTKINLFLDNDQAGRTATQRIMDTCGNVKDWAPVIYPDHKDFNEFFMKAGNISLR
jgi:hypothetical protein